MRSLHVLCAGAAQGLVKALLPQWQAQSGATLQARFGAVGAMKEALAAGEACDVFIVTASMVDALTQSGALHAGTAQPLGQVHTGVAVRVGAQLPDVSTPAALKTTLLAAHALYFPDPERATAGIHFAKVLRELGVYDTLGPRFRTFPNGATAMREMASAGTAQDVGCTQVSEILYTEGVVMVAALPAPFELATTYTAAVASKAAEPTLAAQFITLLCGAATRTARHAAGVESP